VDAAFIMRNVVSDKNYCEDVKSFSLLLEVRMKVLHILSVSLCLLLAGGWTGWGLAADDQKPGQAVESDRRLAQSHEHDETVLPAGQLPSIQDRLVNDEAVFQKIQALQDDPDIQAVLSDSALMEALRAGNLNGVISNPKFMKLLENPAIQEIMKEVQ
jgi:hypothetical protein